MKRTFVSMLVLCVIVGITMLFFSCDSSLISSQDKTGAVTIRLGQTRTIQPVDFKVSKIKVFAKGPGSKDFTLLHEGEFINTGEFGGLTFTAMTQGAWQIRVDGYTIDSNNDVVVASETQTIRITAGTRVDAVFNLRYTTGRGSVGVTVQWPDTSDTSITSVAYTLMTHLGGTVSNGAKQTIFVGEGWDTGMGVDSKTDVYQTDLSWKNGENDTQFETGTYKLVVDFLDGATTVATHTESVNIYAGLKSTKTIELDRRLLPINPDLNFLFNVPDTYEVRIAMPENWEESYDFDIKAEFYDPHDKDVILNPPEGLTWYWSANGVDLGVDSSSFNVNSVSSRYNLFDALSHVTLLKVEAMIEDLHYDHQLVLERGVKVNFRYPEIEYHTITGRSLLGAYIKDSYPANPPENKNPLWHDGYEYYWDSDFTQKVTATDTINQDGMTVYGKGVDLYSIGDEAGGGIVFYVDTKNEFKYVADPWHYLVVSPKDWNGAEGGDEYSSDPKVMFGYYRPDGGTHKTLDPPTIQALGSGKVNTSRIVEEYDGNAYSKSSGGTELGNNYAAKIASLYKDGTYNDWFLPSEEELWQVYLNLVKDNSDAAELYGFDIFDIAGTQPQYWSSSEVETELNRARSKSFANDLVTKAGRLNEYRIRPIRSF